MKIIIASSNNGKLVEIKQFFSDFNVCAYSDLIAEYDIPETGKSFKENAILKAKSVNDSLAKIDIKEDYLVLADDSGISLPILDNAPGIYSARYAGSKATAKDNLEKLIKTLQDLGVKSTPAFYTCAIAFIYKTQVFTTHGFMHGVAISTAKGSGGFGYDPIFVPKNTDQTLGQNPSIKQTSSHRAQALNLALKLIKSFY